MSIYVKSQVKQTCLQQFPTNIRISGSTRMCSGIEFHAAGPACEKARSPNMVRIKAAVVRSQSTTLASDRQTFTQVWSAGIKRLHSAGLSSQSSCVKSQKPFCDFSCLLPRTLNLAMLFWVHKKSVQLVLNQYENLSATIMQYEIEW